MRNSRHSWAAIARAPGYGGAFCDWLLQWDFVQMFPVDFPDIHWLGELCQLLEFDCEALAAQEASLRRKAYRCHVLHDEALSSSVSGFRAIRPQPKPPFVAVST